VTGQNGRIYGQDDVPCDTSDKEAFAALAALLPQGAVWVTSHLSRTTLTARAITAAGLAAPAHLVEEDLAEQSFGHWQSMTWAEIQADFSTEYTEFWRSPLAMAPSGGESFSDLVARVTPVIHRLTAQHRGRDIIAVTHGGTIRGALSHAMNLTPEGAMAIKVDNLSVTRLDHVPGGALHGHGGAWRVHGINHPPR
jgi:alpha-ribazole phosphatase